MYSTYLEISLNLKLKVCISAAGIVLSKLSDLSFQVGLPLEMVHGALRCAAVYLAGVLGGSLAASVLDPDVCLAGASGGVYALLAAHLANALLNFHAMRYGAVRLVAALAVASCDVGFAVHARYTKVSLI